MPIYSDVNLWIGKFSNNVLVYDYDAINQNIFLIITTPIRSKWFDVFLGSNIPRYLFEPMDDETASGIREEIKTLLKRNGEYRLKLQGIRVRPSYAEQLYAVEVNYIAPDLGEKPHQFRFTLNHQRA